MEARELRIGNLITYNGKVISVSPVAINEFYYIGDTHADSTKDKREYKPIPLTEEWLLKFGFKKEEGTPTKNHGNYFSTWVMDYKYSFSYAPFRGDWGFYHSYTDAPDPKEDNRFDFISCGINYVHQLQNLYFALTGEELEIKDSYPL